jgi:hypothetical protein
MGQLRALGASFGEEEREGVGVGGVLEGGGRERRPRRHKRADLRLIGEVLLHALDVPQKRGQLGGNMAAHPFAAFGE